MKIFGLILVLLLVFGHVNIAHSQRKTKLNTNNKGTMFVYFGYNRSAYSAADLHITGSNYDFTLGETSFSDNEEEVGMGEFFNSSSPQFNLHLGYYIAHKWAITLGVDRLNLFMRNNQTLSVDGTFAPGAHSDFSGTYNTQPLEINREQIYFRQRSGVNYFRVGLLRTDQHYKSRKAEFAFNTNLGIGVGPLVSNTDYTFDGVTTQNVSSVSGWGLSAHVGMRFDFFQHVFLQTTLSGGVLNQQSLQLSTNSSVTARTVTGYISPEISVGFNLFIKPTNGCGTCPQW